MLATCSFFPLEFSERVTPLFLYEGIVGFLDPMRRNPARRFREILLSPSHLLGRLADGGFESTPLLVESASRQRPAAPLPRFLQRGATFTVQPQRRIGLNVIQPLADVGEEPLTLNRREFGAHRWLEFTQVFHSRHDLVEKIEIRRRALCAGREILQ